MAFESAEYLSERILQLPETPEGRLLCPQTGSQNTDSRNLPSTQRRGWVSEHDRLFVPQGLSLQLFDHP